MRKYLLFPILFFLLNSTSFSFSPEEYLDDRQEKRAKKLFLQIKCPVCEGQVIENSNTQAAANLRKLIRDQIKDGKSDKEIKSYLVNKFGEEILISPPFNSSTFLLWFLPVIFITIGTSIIFLKKWKK